MAMLTPRFSGNRADREYTENYYMSAADNFKRRSTEKGAAGKKIAHVHHELQQEWSHIQFGEVLSENVENGHVFHVQVKLNGLRPENILVEL
jgi:starch phosphorylase